MTTYIVAVKRGKRTEAPPSWIEELGKTSGVNLEQVSNPRRAQVQATEDGIRAVREKYGSFLRVEEKINHSTN